MPQQQIEHQYLICDGIALLATVLSRPGSNARQQTGESSVKAGSRLVPFSGLSLSRGSADLLETYRKVQRSGRRLTIDSLHA